MNCGIIFQEVLSDEDKMETVKTSNSESIFEVSKSSTDKEDTSLSEKHDDKKSDFGDDIGKYCTL